MRYRKFGDHGFEVSLLSMGCMRLPCKQDGEGNSYVDREKAYELIRYAADNGVNHFDTAFGYHARTSEEVLGEALEGERRKKVRISTKLPFNFMQEPGDIRKNLENTLNKLRTDYLDFYFIHGVGPGNWEQIKEKEILKEYEKLRTEGMIRSIGFSYHGNYEHFKDVINQYDWGMCLVQHNMLDINKEVTEEGIIQAGKRGIPLITMEPLRGGGLAQMPARVREIYDSYPEKRSAAEWAFRFLIDKPQVCSVLSGMTTMEQLKENIAILSKPDLTEGCLSPREKDIIAKAREAYQALITIPCTACEYCMPCPKGVAISRVLSCYNDGMMFEYFDQPRRSYMFVNRGGGAADNCTECGECEPKCPQNIDIINQLKVAHSALRGWNEV